MGSIDQYRKRAADARVLADLNHSEELKREIERVADEYDTIADWLEVVRINRRHFRNRTANRC